MNSIFSAIAQLFRLLAGRQEAKNQPDVRAAAKAKAAVQESNRIESAVAKRDTNETRNILAE